jgi:hypothetical protein
MADGRMVHLNVATPEQSEMIHRMNRFHPQASMNQAQK